MRDSSMFAALDTVGDSPSGVNLSTLTVIRSSQPAHSADRRHEPDGKVVKPRDSRHGAQPGTLAAKLGAAAFKFRKPLKT